MAQETPHVKRLLAFGNVQEHQAGVRMTPVRPIVVSIHGDKCRATSSMKESHDLVVLKPLPAEVIAELPAADAPCLQLIAL